MINCHIKEISLFFFILVLSATNLCCGFCRPYQELKKNLALYEALAEKTLENIILLCEEHPGSFPYKISYTAGNGPNTSNNNRYIYINKLCEKLNIISIQVNADNNVFLFFPSNSNFYQGELIEEFVEFKEQGNRRWTDFQKESSERQIQCEVKLSNKTRYVKIRSSN